MSNLFAARLIASLFIISTASYSIASELISPVLSLPDFLQQIYPNKNTLVIAALLEFVNSAAAIGIAIVIYPIIKQFNERIALTYLSFRIVEGIMLLIGATALMSLVKVGKELLEVSATSAPYLQSMADVLITERAINFQMGMISLSLCGFILCITFYQYRLIPRALTIIGLVGYVLLLVKVTSGFFSIKLGGDLMYAPVAFFELALPLWLIFKGFHLPEKIHENEVNR